jgi:hypothetical protein
MRVQIQSGWKIRTMPSQAEHLFRVLQDEAISRGEEGAVAWA